MDAHFAEYLAAVEGMQEIYGEREEGFPTEYHDDSVPAIETVSAAEHPVAAPFASHWDV